MRDVIEKVIAEFIETYQKNPFDYFFEADIQAILSGRVRESLGTQITLDTAGSPDSCLRERKSIRTSNVKTEYPSDWEFDIALIDPDLRVLRTTGTYNQEHPDNKSDAMWGQRVSTAIEIKLQKIGDLNLGKFVKGFQSDRKKIRAYAPYYEKGSCGRRFTGIALFFSHYERASIEREFERRNLKLVPWLCTLDPGIQSLVVTPTGAARMVTEVPAA